MCGWKGSLDRRVRSRNSVPIAPRATTQLFVGYVMSNVYYVTLLASRHNRYFLKFCLLSELVPRFLSPAYAFYLCRKICKTFKVLFITSLKDISADHMEHQEISSLANLHIRNDENEAFYVEILNFARSKSDIHASRNKVWHLRPNEGRKVPHGQE